MTELDATKIDQLASYLKNAKNPVFFGGAGVSTESGIPDFRSTDGIYNQEYDYPPETILSHTFFMNKPSEFWRFYRSKMLIFNAKPNPAHSFLANRGIPVITQNIDGLHTFAGSEKVYELHGSVLRNYCMKCGTFYGAEAVLGFDEPPRDSSCLIDYDATKLTDKQLRSIPLCNASVASGGTCGGLIKPDVVLYEEPLDPAVWDAAEQLVINADLLIVAGTSMKVYPAASLVSMFTNMYGLKGSVGGGFFGGKIGGGGAETGKVGSFDSDGNPLKALVVINRDPVSADNSAQLVIHSNVGEVFTSVQNNL
ncbi:MAG: NAD-dependent deacylase [Bifidobacteriaceae bacterium]|jgi:NAD-dependent deacetylase|nr:NAD-dependent deacylase [Bifidobacteriaceae bacterium]